MKETFKKKSQWQPNELNGSYKVMVTMLNTIFPQLKLNDVQCMECGGAFAY